jgi:hypothetical protein
MVERRLILRRDEGVALPNKMAQDIASAINRAHFHQKTPAHIQMMSVKRDVKGTIMVITHQKTTAAVALTYRDVIINKARMVDMEDIDVVETKSLERLKVHAVPLIRYMSKGTDGLQKMRDDIHVENEGVVISV